LWRDVVTEVMRKEFEAPDIAGQDKANPLAMIFSAAMMLRYDLDRELEAKILEDAVDIVVLDQGYRTADIKKDGDNCKLVGCDEIGRNMAVVVTSMP
jgi:3-isopropylmalate dehydrogenase